MDESRGFRLQLCGLHDAVYELMPHDVRVGPLVEGRRAEVINLRARYRTGLTHEYQTDH
jgi:hypothetical protein